MSHSKPAPRILVVEDDLALKPVLAALLDSIDPSIELSWASDATGVLSESSERGRAFRKGFDLILADLILPGTQSGLDLWELCRAEGLGPRFLLSSGMTFEQFRQSFVGDYAADGPFFMPKNIPIENRRQIIRTVLADAALTP